MPEETKQLNFETPEAAQEAVKKEWKPEDAQKARIKFVYDERTEMVTKRNQSYVQFNDRTLKEFIDDSEKRLNAYVLDKASQGKEDWQANFATRAYANKAKALLAATSRDLPDMHFKAVNDEDQYDHFAADIAKNLVRHSYYQGNPQEELFFLAWSNVGHGTVLSCEDIQKNVYQKARIKSFDLMTGDIEEEMLEKESYGEPYSYEINLMHLLVKNFYIRDIQEQPALIHETFYADKERFTAIFGRYPNADFVKDLADIKKEEHDTYFHKLWNEGCKDGKGYLVSRYMNKYTGRRGTYRIIANGIELYNGPMLWTDITRRNFGRPAYPIAKTIFEPFANSDFFYGNSMPNAAMGEGDVINTLYNTGLDKNYRAMVPPLLIGMVNKDMLDLEDEVVAGDTKIYVDDISQVKQMELKGITDSDVKMIDLISRGLDLTTLDPQQQGQAQKYVTARAAVAADERAKQLKGVFFMFMESLWLQKIRLRLPNILLTYTMPKLVEIIGEDGAKKLIEKPRTFNVKRAELSNGTTGTLGVEFRSRDQMGDHKALKLDVEAEEEKNNLAGTPYEKIIMPYDQLNNLSYDIEIVPETLWQASQAINMAMTIEKISLVNKIFPEYFAENKELFFRDLLKGYSDDAGRYKLPKPMDFSQEKGLELAMGQAGKRSNGSSAGGGLVSDVTGVDTNNNMGESPAGAGQ
ncbi:MAG: hypothetical protein NUV80_04615 [Candidatus Berkelbacteria bacterium]|nr:hypothetical protein [Candidatus Berkelbacteria bacterium]